MYIRKYRYFVGDFETTTYKGQTFTEVWASGVVELFKEDVVIHNSIQQTFDYLCDIDDNVVIYYHNLKFDGAFWLSYFLIDKGFEQAIETIDEETNKYRWLEEKEMKNNTFKYSISHMGQWYTIVIKVNNKFIEIRDSYKLLPFSLKRIGESFKTKHRKLEMEYEGFRYAGCEITDREKEYLKNDLLVIKEALEIMFNDKHNKLTIGSCCLHEFKKGFSKADYNQMFPDMYNINLDTSIHKYRTAGHWIRKAYKGGWCYVVEGKENKIHHNGTTYDVNSLYPSVMHSMSGNKYPVGSPIFWYGNYIPDACFEPDTFFFIRIKTRFYIRDGYLPFIQIKDNLLYKGNECLKTSDVFDGSTGTYHREYLNLNGEIEQARVELTLTETDFKLLREHYVLEDFEIIDGCHFFAESGMFDKYIDKYKKIKQENKGAVREQAKLFLNNLYGKMASNTDSSFKLAYVKEDKSIGFITVLEDNKKAGYIPIGACITSYAREFTIRTAQKNYYGADKRGFIYADTDSIHCDLTADEIKGIVTHDTEFCCWKQECVWDKAIFARQKTYIEHIVEKDGKPLDTPKYDVKCAGMPDRCKHLFIQSMMGYTPKEDDKYNQEEKEFITTKRTMEDFKIGLVVPSKLMPKRIMGGIVLTSTTYEMR